MLFGLGNAGVVAIAPHGVCVTARSVAADLCSGGWGHTRGRGVFSRRGSVRSAAIRCLGGPGCLGGLPGAMGRTRGPAGRGALCRQNG